MGLWAHSSCCSSREMRNKRAEAVRIRLSNCRQSSPSGIPALKNDVAFSCEVAPLARPAENAELAQPRQCPVKARALPPWRARAGGDFPPKPSTVVANDSSGADNFKSLLYACELEKERTDKVFDDIVTTMFVCDPQQ